jgi:hypothetical protein
MPNTYLDLEQKTEAGNRRSFSIQINRVQLEIVKRYDPIGGLIRYSSPLVWF